MPDHDYKQIACNQKCWGNNVDVESELLWFLDIGWAGIGSIHSLSVSTPCCFNLYRINPYMTHPCLTWSCWSFAGQGCPCSQMWQDNSSTAAPEGHLLGIVLYVGNYLNGGTPRGRADGFALDTLAQMRTVKMWLGTSWTEDGWCLYLFLFLRILHMFP